MDISIARAEELPDLFANVHESWPHASDVHEHVRLRLASVQHRHADWYRLKQGYKIASSLGVYPFKIRRGTEVFTLGMIGAVHTSPEFRGQSLAPKLFSYVHNHLKEKGIDFVGLYSDIKPGYYARLGYIEQDVLHASVELSALKNIASSLELDKLEKDQPIMERLAALYNQQTKQIKGSIERELSHWKWICARNTDASYYLLQVDGNDLGYVVVGDYEGRPSVIDWVINSDDIETKLSEALSLLSKTEQCPDTLEIWLPKGKYHSAFRTGKPEHSVPMICPLDDVKIGPDFIDFWQPMDHV